MSITTPGRNDVDRTELDRILNGYADRDLLRVLRTETQLIVLAARVVIEENKAARKEAYGA